jgi:hypothetical protein
MEKKKTKKGRERVLGFEEEAVQKSWRNWFSPKKMADYTAAAPYLSFPT